MIRRGALLVSLAIAAIVAATPRAHADDIVAAVAATGDDVRATILVGPSGQVWEPDGQGAWARRTAGGVAADVRGAAVAGAALVVAGKATPLYRREAARWSAMRLGERGRTTIGRGPRAALAIGRLVFVWTGTSWKRVGAAPGVAVALWAASETKVVVATETELFRLAGGGFRPAAATATAVVHLDGATAWAVTRDGAAFDVAGRRAHRPTVGGQPMTVGLVTSAGDTTWALGTTAGGPALARLRKGVWAEVSAPPLTPDDPPVGMVADSRGALLVVTRGGALHLAASDGTWSTGTRSDAVPAAPTGSAGPGPARTR